MKRILLFLVTFFSSLYLLGQIKTTVEIPWKGDKTIGSLYGEKIDLLAFPYNINSDGNYCFVYKELHKGATSARWLTQVTSYKTTPASNFDKQFLEKNNIKVASEVAYIMKPKRARIKEYFTFEIIPYIEQNGQLMRITSVDFSIKYIGAIKTSNNSLEKSFAATSVLKSGDWYKIFIPASGVYKIDNAFLEQLGVSTSGLNSNSINVYGNAMGMLPIENSAYHPDDLLKNTIKMNDGGDGTFDDQDYFLFYANGPDEKRYTPGYGMQIINNLYVDKSTYFIHIDASDAPARISNAALSSNPANVFVSTSNNVVAHEKDLYNYIKSGQRWYGELFDSQLSYTIPFILSNIVTTKPIQLFTSLANTGTGSGSKFNVLINGNLNQSIDCINAGGYTVAARETQQSNDSVTSSNVSIQLTLNRLNPSVQARLDKLEINFEQFITYIGQQLDFRNIASVGMGNVAQFTVGNAIGTTIWEITSPTQPKTINAPAGIFKVAMDSLRKFIVFKVSDAKIPEAGNKIYNQNLHALPFADLLIVTHPDFTNQANRLANLHRANGTTAHVVTTTQVYNEFSSGMVDPCAIRWFTKMFYDRAAGNANNMPKSLCLFGDGTYDPKNRITDNNYMVPTYQVSNSSSAESYTGSYTSDDFFVILDNTEAFSPSDLLDVGAGRIIATSAQQAVDLVNKIEHYMHNGSSLYPNQAGENVDENGYSSTFGDWRLWITQIADDEESAYFVNDQEGYYQNYSSNHPILNGDKIYLDAFQQISMLGGQRYPEVVTAINNSIARGTLMMNYVGHGGETGLALERILTIPQILSWNNINQLPLFVSATCEFTRYDDPSRVSAGEEMYLSNHGGAIALLTTTRPVTFTTNSIVGSKLYDNVFDREANGKPLTLGEIIRRTKNTAGSGYDKPIFTLIGDPALRLKLPPLAIVIDSVNGKSPAIAIDTLRSLSKATIKAHIENAAGNLMSGFNGIAYPSVFDKSKKYITLGQDPTSQIDTFQMQKNYLYHGKSTVKNGRFEFSFIVPKDIDYDFGYGKISLYANSSSVDFSGVDKRIVVGGIDPNGIVDDLGPEIKLYMNDRNFVNQGLTDENPIFLADLYDENGINTVGNGIGHDITAVLDANSAKPIVLNQYYKADLDTYKSGKTRYLMHDLDPGRHTITLRVWDVNNNSSEATIEFTVVENKEIAIDHVLNYPNPFTTHTEFYFEHNQVDVNLEVQIQIMTITGKLVKTINRSVSTNGFRSQGIPWNGRDDFGDQLAKGVYVYKLTVNAPDGSTANKIEKLVLLK